MLWVVPVKHWAVVAPGLSNPTVKTRFESIKDMDHAKQMAREFFCVGCGGPESYTGKDTLPQERKNDHDPQAIRDQCP